MSKFTHNIVSILAAFLVVSCMIFLFMAAFATVVNDQALIAITGTLSMVVGFYFGATHKKDEEKPKTFADGPGGSNPPPDPDDK